MSKQIEEMAKKMVGDGGTPNKFFVGVSSDYSYLEGNEINYIGDLVPHFEKKYARYDMVGVFPTREKAMEEAGEFHIGMKYGNFVVNRIWIEDRLQGEVYLKENVLDIKNGKFFENEYGD